MAWKAPQAAKSRDQRIRDIEHIRVSQDFEDRFLATQEYLNQLIQAINDSDLEITLPNPPVIAHPRPGQIGGG